MINRLAKSDSPRAFSAPLSVFKLLLFPAGHF